MVSYTDACFDRPTTMHAAFERPAPAPRAVSFDAFRGLLVVEVAEATARRVYEDVPSDAPRSAYAQTAEHVRRAAQWRADARAAAERRRATWRPARAPAPVFDDRKGDEWW